MTDVEEQRMRIRAYDLWRQDVSPGGGAEGWDRGGWPGVGTGECRRHVPPETAGSGSE